MPQRVELYAVLICCVSGLAQASQPRASVDVRPLQAPPALPPVLYNSSPIVLCVAALSADIDSATVSDVAVADFNADGRNDIAVAWYATDNQSMAANRRMLTLYFSEGVTFRRGPDLNLYVPDYNLPARSVFRNGTAAVAVGDFDNDGDKDLAVTAFFGDELWLIENLGGGQFAQHLRFPFGYNSTGIFQTPPEALAADFDDDGRDDLVYICDPVQHIDGLILHFWRTSGAIANMQRVEWWSGPGGGWNNWTRGLAVADFDADGRLDVCFTACHSPALETNPVLRIWYGLDPAAGWFSVRTETLGVVCSDVVDVNPSSSCRPGLILTDLNGTTAQYWSAACQGPPDFALTTHMVGYAGLSTNRGMTAIVADVNGDGYPDLVTKQKLGGLNDRNQIEITLGSADGNLWTRVSPSPIDTGGFQNEAFNEILRPRNLAAADLFGNALPELVAGFGASPGYARLAPGGGSGFALPVAIWPNSCLGDVNVDGQTNAADIGALIAALNAYWGDPRFNPNADLNKDRVVDLADLRSVLTDVGCRCAACDSVRVADTNCDGQVSWRDIASFGLALSGRAAYETEYPSCNWLNADCNGDGTVSWRDIEPFLIILAAAQSPPGGGNPNNGTALPGSILRRNGRVRDGQLQ